MRLSISRSRESIWVWLFWGLGTYLVLESGPFFIVGSVLKKTAGEMAGPYLAFALPAVIVMPLIWWLRKWEEGGASPKRLAHGWGLSMALWVLALAVAVFYSGAKFRLMTPSDAGISFVTSALFSGLILYFVGYHRALARLSSKADEKLGGAACPK